MGMSKQSRQNLWVWGALVAAVVVVGAILASRYYVEREVKETVYPSRQADKNAHLALQRLLEKNQISSHVNQTPFTVTQMPDTKTVVLMSRFARQPWNRADSEILNQWIAAGGHLMLVVRDYDFNDDEESTEAKMPWQKSVNATSRLHVKQLLAQWGVTVNVSKNQVYVNDEIEVFHPAKPAVAGALWQPNPSEKYRWTKQHLDPNPLHSTADQDGSRYATQPFGFTARPEEAQGGQVRVLMAWRHQWRDEQGNVQERTANTKQAFFEGVQLTYGQGVVTIVTEDVWLRNDYLPNRDHAYWAYRLLTTSNPAHPQWPNHVLIVSKMNPLNEIPWWEIMYQRAPWVAYGLFGLLLVCLWWYRTQSGPRLMPLSHARQNLKEHLQAAGWLVYRPDKGQFWLTHTRALLQSQVQGQEGGQKPHDVQGETVPDDFVRYTQVLQRRACTRWQDRLRRRFSVSKAMQTDLSEPTDFHP